MKLFNDLHYLPMSFCPLDSFCPRIILPPPPLFCPWKLFNNLHYLPMSHVILPPGFILPHIILPPSHILPPGNCLMIYTIYPCPMSFCLLDSFCPRIILPPYYFAPPYFAPGNCLIIYTIYTCPMSFCPLDSFCPHIILPPPPLYFAPWKLFNDLHYLPMSHVILPPGFILPPYQFPRPPPPYFAPRNF